VSLGAELTSLINLKKEMNLIVGKIIGMLQVIKGVVSPVEEKKCNVKWKEKLQQQRLYFIPITIKSIKQMISARLAVTFKCSGKLREKVNEP